MQPGGGNEAEDVAPHSSLAEQRLQSGVAAEVRQDAELHLRIVRCQQHAAYGSK